MNYMKTFAHEQLKVWLEKEGLSQEWLAHVLETNQSTVSRWVNGDTKPDIQYRMAIRYLSRSSVHIDDWFSPEEHEIAYRFQNKTNYLRAIRLGKP
ncbi:MAG: helix-turn-helix transcriptional regulator [Planctomycetota bacterium]|jgi:DNA-binding transcriptional regulator YiaG